MDDHTYDLIKGLGENAEALSVYKKYQSDAHDCSECKALWKRMEEQEEKDIADMKRILADHAGNGALN